MTYRSYTIIGLFAGFVLLPACIGNIRPESAALGASKGATVSSTCSAPVDSCHVAGALDAVSGVCGAPVAMADGTPCNDQNACTQHDVCVAGSCVGSAVVCATSNSCQTATCDPSAGCQVKNLDDLCSTTLQPESLKGCWIGSYGLNMAINGNIFNMMVDTGSQVTAVALGPCTTCNGTTPTYSGGPTAVVVDPNGFFEGYGDGSGWDAIGMEDIVTPGDHTPALDMTFGGIYNTVSSGGKVFFSSVNCDDTNAQYGIFQGIVGMSAGHFQDSNIIGNFADDIYKATNRPDAFALQLCDRTGSIWFGGYDRKAMAADPLFVPMLPVDNTGAYRVTLGDLQVGGTSVGVPPQTPIYVDSGTDGFVMPQAAYDTFVSHVRADPNFTTFFSTDLLDGILYCQAPLISATRAQLDALLPKVTFVYTAANGAPVRLEMPATHSYLQPMNFNGSMRYCSALTVGSEFFMSGPALQSHVVVFDRANSQIGFAPQVGCVDVRGT